MATDYTYIVARLRALEAELPDASWFQRLARTSGGGLLTMMREHFHGFEKVSAIEDYEEGFEAERSAFARFLSSMIDDPAALSFMRSGYDFDDALFAWKAKRLGSEPLSSGTGLVGGELVGKGLEDHDREFLPVHLRDFLAEIGKWGEKGQAALVQYAGEAMKYRYLLQIAPGRAARDYLRIKIDLMNIGTVIRIKRSALRKTEPDRALLEGGRIERGKMAGFLKESEEELYTFLRTSDYRGLLELGLGAEMPLWKLDAASRAFLLGILGESRLSFFDFSPVLYHIELRERNEHVARTIIVGRLNGMPEDMILERVEALQYS